MTFTVDSHFLIGQTHINSGSPCQDYADSGNDLAGGTYAVLSDGCSTGKRTDIGARIIALTTARSIKSHMDLNVDEDDRSFYIARSRLTLELNRDDLLATSVSMLFNEKGGYVSIEGDGVVAVKYRDGNIAIKRYDWTDNAPWYPYYSESEEDREKFIQMHGGDLYAERLTKTLYVKGSESDSKHTYGVALVDGMRGKIETYRGIDNIDCIAIFSDGVTQIEGVEWTEAVLALISFKQVGGLFVKRRLNAQVKKWNDEGKKHLDDLSMAVIKVNHG